MRICTVVTFSLPLDFSLGGLIEQRETVLAPLRACFPGLVEQGPDGRDEITGDGEIILDYPEPKHAARIENELLDGTVRIPLPELGDEFDARVYISSLSIGFVIFDLAHCRDDIDLDLEAADGGNGLRALEAPYRQAVGARIRQWCEEMKRRLGPLDCVQLRPEDLGVLPSGKMLWWHRILVDPGPNVPMSVAAGVPCELGETTCSVGYLFSSVTNATEPALRHLVNGLILASQNWLIIDDATRLAANKLMTADTDGPYTQQEIDRQYDEILDLTGHATFRSVVFGESARYVSNTEYKVKEAIEQAWGIAEEGRTLGDRMAALREMFNLRRERVANRRDETRNRVIVALTSLTVFQCIFIWYDFYTGTDTTAGDDPRPLISFTTLAGTIIGFLVLPFLPTLWHRLKRRLRASPPDGPGPMPPVVPIAPPRTPQPEPAPVAEG
ncbi:hypothetical protein SRB5_41790 [Streptomyces sp. RB5]|uniref:Uncharacterized protein n=1 Tax=Streptomyces smaragdinus TaxID=2585196 RepID=A0A7K0CKL5_9ACTN|nr:hypothetical protein [Streptomyces smaragdinus]MQY14018.1 hypothetical protein [Streptomyces smaragdinus]